MRRWTSHEANFCPAVSVRPRRQIMGFVAGTTSSRGSFSLVSALCPRERMQTILASLFMPASQPFSNAIARRAAYRHLMGKNQRYSLQGMLDSDPLVDYFVGGTVYQAFFSEDSLCDGAYMLWRQVFSFLCRTSTEERDSGARHIQQVL